MRKYTSDHEWIEFSGGEATVGITEFASKQLGDLVFVGLPAIGAVLKKGESASTVESVKAASEIYAPLDGVVSAINEQLHDNPALVNDKPLTDGWFLKLKVSDEGQIAELIDEAEYAALVGDA